MTAGIYHSQVKRTRLVCFLETAIHGATVLPTQNINRDMTEAGFEPAPLHQTTERSFQSKLHGHVSIYLDSVGLEPTTARL